MAQRNYSHFEGLIPLCHKSGLRKQHANNINIEQNERQLDFAKYLAPNQEQTPLVGREGNAVGN